MGTGQLRRGLRLLGSLLSPRGFRLLLTSQLLNQVADGLYQIALASVLIFGLEAARTPAQVTKVLAVTLLPFSLVGPFTGPFIDRFSRRSILVGTSVVRTGLILLLVPALDWPEPVLLSLAVATVSTNRFYHATKNAVLPTVVPPRQYLGANAVSSTAGMVFALAGAVVGGPLADAVTPRLPILLAATCTVGSALAATRLALPRGERRGLAGILGELRDDLRDVGEGLRVLVGTPSATYAVSSTWAMRALHGFIILAALVVGRARFDIGASGFSVVLAAVGVGGFVGALLVPAVARRVGRPGVAPLAFALAGVATLIGGPLSVWA
ncbi:MAG: MFS transporter, partial [Actinomycetota bacterium]